MYVKFYKNDKVACKVIICNVCEVYIDANWEKVREEMLKIFKLTFLN